MELETKKIKVNGLNFNVFDKGNGKTILLLHGFPDSIKVWRKIIPLLLEDGYRVIAYDQRGFGETDAPKNVEDYRVANIVGDIVAILNILGVNEKVKVIAHDWGAFIGWAFSVTYPRIVDSYVAISVGHPISYLKFGGFEQKQKGWYTMAFQDEGLAEKLFSDNNWAALRTFTQNNPELEKNWIPDLERPQRFTAALNWYRANLNPKYKDKSAKIPKIFVRVPVLGVYGTQDHYLSKAQMLNSKRFVWKKFSYFEIEGAGHWIPTECPEKLMTEIRSFWASNYTK